MWLARSVQPVTTRCGDLFFFDLQIVLINVACNVRRTFNVDFARANFTESFNIQSVLVYYVKRLLLLNKLYLTSHLGSCPALESPIQHNVLRLQL